MATMQSVLRGITTPIVTPFDGTGIDWTAYETLLSQLGEAGVDTVFVCGTTGEFASLTHDERRRVVEQAVQTVPDAMSIIAGGTGTNRNDAVEWIKTTANLGVDAAVVTAPYFHTSNGLDGLQRFFERVADQSPLPILLYNLPACVGEAIPVEVVADLATHDSIIGLKDSGGDLTYGLRTKHRTPGEFLLLQGFDTLLLPSLRVGFDGGVNALSNAIPDAYLALYEDPASERAQDLHREAIEPLFDLCRKEGFAPATKAALAERGIIPSNGVRPPLVPVEGEAVRAAVDSAEAVLSRQK